MYSPVQYGLADVRGHKNVLLLSNVDTTTCTNRKIKNCEPKFHMNL